MRRLFHSLAQERRPDMERFTIGQMAQLNHVTKKTLMLYHREGLLIPEEVDPVTGYRYYSLSQCSTLDIIQQMKQIGLSLSEIREVLEKKDVSHFRRLLLRQTEQLQDTMKQLLLSQNTAQELLGACRLCLDKPVCNVVTLEYVPRRRILRFPVPPYYMVSRREGDPWLNHWEIALRTVKDAILRQKLPLALFHNVGGIASLPSLRERRPRIIGGYVFNPQGFGGQEEYWPEGYYLTVTIEKVFSDDGLHMEYAFLQKFLDIIDEEGYTLCGEYRSEILAETPAFLFEGREMMLRLRVPVQVKKPEESRYFHA